MKVADAVELLEDELTLGNRWFQTDYRIIRTVDLIHELKRIDQNFVVIRFEINRRTVVPGVSILVDGRNNQ